MNYPKEEIIALLSGRNRRVGTDLVADVLDQSADQLIDGVTSAQENRYTFSHYYGQAQRREGIFNQIELNKLIQQEKDIRNILRK